MDRRAFVTAIATTPLAATATGATETDPLIYLVKKWFEVTKAWVALEEDTPEAETLWDERSNLAIEICKTEATTLKGLVAQVDYFRSDLGYVFEDDVHDDYAKITTTIQSGLKKLAA